MDGNKYEIRGLAPRHSIVLRRKGAGQVWTARIQVPRDECRHDVGRVERSTGFRDLDPAIAQAHRLHYEILNPSRTVSPAESNGALTFSEAVELFLRRQKEKTESHELSVAEYERERISLLRHFVPEFGARPIKEITKRQLSTFRTKRLQNGHRPESASEIVYQRGGETLRYQRALRTPSNETLRRERSAFHALMAWAVEEGYITTDDAPSYRPRRGGAECHRDH